MAFTALSPKRHISRCHPLCFEMINPHAASNYHWDTKFDRFGSKNRYKSLMLAWGFGEEADLLSYQPDWIAHTIDDIISQFQP